MEVPQPTTEVPQTLDEFYSERHPTSALTHAFLSGKNMVHILQRLNQEVRKDTGLSNTPPITFTEQILSQLMLYAKEYVATPVEYLENVNTIFVQSMRDGMVWEANHNNQYKRWETEGIPDPNNVPRPTNPDRGAQEVETSDYLLSHPWGGRIPRY